MNWLKKKYWHYFFIFGCILIIGLAGASIKHHKNTPKYSILFIHSYSKGPTWQEDLTTEFVNFFHDQSLNVSIDTLYLETDTSTVWEIQQRLTEHLVKREQNPPQLIFACNDQATYALLESKHPLAYRVPVVFSGLNYYDKSMFKNHFNITGFTSIPDIKKGYALAKKLLKENRDMHVIGDGTKTSMQLKSVLMGQTDKEQDSTAYNYFNIYTRNIKDIMYWISFYSKNVYMIMPKWNNFYSRLAHESGTPFFLINNQGFGDGSLGGYMVPLRKQARSAAQRGLEILRGKPVKEIPISELEQVPVFDWRELQKWNININNLPKNSFILYIPFVERYKIPLQTGGSIFFVFIVVALIQLTRLYREETKQKKDALDKLILQGKELDLTLKSIPDGVVSVDLANNILTINNAALKFLGLTKDTSFYIGKNIYAIMDINLPGNSSYLHEILSLTKGQNKSISLDEAAYITAPSIKSFPIRGDVASIYRNGISFGAVITFTNISGELIQNELMRIALQSGKMFTVTVNKKGAIYDPSFFSYCKIQNKNNNYLSDEDFFKIIHPDDIPAMLEIIQKNTNKNNNKFNIKIRIFIIGKGYQLFEYRLSSIYNPVSLTEKYYFGIAINIQPFKEAEEELVKARDKAKQSDALKSAFLANMSHEIRTPLNAIVGFSNLLTSNDDYVLEDKQMFIDAINNNCRLLLALITDILDLSRIESGSMSFKYKRCDINELISQIVNTQQVIIPSNLQLIKEIPQESAVIMIDSIRLNQVLTNLINNAVKFTSEGYIKVGYTKDDHGFLNFYVEDTGHGIAQEDIKNVFCRFYKKNEFTQGAGLGLSICKVIVDRFKGVIDIHSEVGKGTRFDVRIPCIPLPETTPKKYFSQQPEVINNQSPITTKLKRDKATILIAEDEESNYLLIKTILRNEYNLLHARNGQEAIELFQSDQPDLILMDIKMPVMTGIEALIQIRKKSIIPIIMLSAYVFDSNIEIARQAGSTDYLPKPVNKKLLQEILEKHLLKKRKA